MEGRHLRLMLCGGLILGGSLTGCTRKQTMPGGQEMPPFLQAAAPKKSPSLFGTGTSMPTPPSATPPPQAAATEPTASKHGTKKEWSPDSIVAFADLRASMAFSEDRKDGDREKYVDAAREAYQNALKKDPKHKGAMLGLAKLYTALGEVDRADEMYRRYLTLNPKDHAVMHEVALSHVRVQDWKGAATWCQQALKVDPENRSYRKTLGFSLTHAGKWEEGFTVLCDVMPEAQARYSMARALANLNQPEMSRQQLMLAIQVDPTFIPARELLAEMSTPTEQPVAAPQVHENVQTVGYQQITP